MKGAELKVSPFFWAAAALMWLLAGLPVFVATASAAILHELGHAVAVAAFSGKIRAVRLEPDGLLLETEFEKLPSYGGELVCIAAGPAANAAAGFLFAAFARNGGFYLLAGVNLALAAFNLLPAAGFDGGRIFLLVTARFFGPDRAERAARAVDVAAAAAVTAGAAWVYFNGGGGLALLCAMLYIAGRIMYNR